MKAVSKKVQTTTNSNYKSALFKTGCNNVSKCMLLAITLTATPVFADKDTAHNYGDINDEDGRYVSLQQKISAKASANDMRMAEKKVTATKKQLSATKLNAEDTVGYGDLNREEE